MQTQSGTRAKSSPGAVPSSKLGRPKSSPSVKSPNAHSAHGLTPHYSSSEASRAAEATSASPEVSPSRPLTARRISASSEGEVSPPKSRRTPPRSRPPQTSPPRGLGAGELRLVRDPPRRTGAVAQPLDGTGAFIANHSADESRSHTVSVARHTADMTRAPSACPRHCAAIPGAV